MTSKHSLVDGVLLQRGWRFALDPDGDPSQPGYDDSGWRAVSVPHDWQIESRRDARMAHGAWQGYYPREGVGWYRLSLTAADTQGVTRLLFDGVQRFYEIYVNGTLAGKKAYGYVPYACEIHLAPGENLIAVKVDNRALEVEGGGGDRWYSGAGIYRDVTLLADGPTHILPYGVRVGYALSGDAAQVALTLALDNRAKAGAYGARVTVTAPDSVQQAETFELTLPAGQSEQSVAFALANVSRWDIDAPLLYDMHVELLHLGRAIDRQVVRTGFRESSFDADRGYFLNGRPLKLKGVNLHHDAGAFGAAVPHTVLRRRLQRIKALGCNAIRCAHNPKESGFYALCDEMGFLVIDELYDKWAHQYFRLFFETDCLEDLRAMVDRTRNHPCVILWSVGNECGHQYSETFFKQLQALCDACRELDPSRPVSYALIGHGGCDFSDPAVYRARLDMTLRYAQIVDVFMGNYMESFYEALRREGMRRAVIGSEIFSYYRHVELTAHDMSAQNPWRDVEAHDYVAGGFLWAGIDYLGESMGWPSRGWTGCPIDSAGFFKLRAYLTQSLWVDEPMVKIAVFDESDPYDMANGNWGFPQMVGHWNQHTPHKMLHVGVMTNCDTVKLTLEDGLPRWRKPEADRMAHFYVVYMPGTLRAEGYIDGKLVATQVLRTTDQAERPMLSIYEKRIQPGDVFHAEVSLHDHYGQLFTQERPRVRFQVQGAASLVALDNGDFNTTQEIFAATERTLWNGRVCAFLRAADAPGPVTVTVIVEGYAPLEATCAVEEAE